MTVRSATHRAAVALGLDRIAVQALRRRLLILCYHGVSEGPADVPDVDGLHLPRDLFATQLEWLLRHFRPVGIDDLRAAACGGPALPDRACLVTFDDGYRNVLRNALPVLRRKGVPAAVFVVAGLVESRQWLWTSLYDWVNHSRPDAGSTKRWLKGLSASERGAWLSVHARLEPPLPDCDNTLASLFSGSCRVTLP